MPKVLIKIGGSTVNSTGLLTELADSVHEIHEASNTVMLVHGGGKDIARDLEKLNKEFTFVQGMRITDSETMHTVQKVLSGDVNKRIVATFLKEKVKALGISGVDGGLLTAEKLMIDGEDIGFVGKIKAVDTALLDLVFTGGFVPIISPVSLCDKDYEVYNINADLAASEIAVADNVDDLIFISDVPGVLIDGKVKKTIHINEIEGFIEEEHITCGMIPKMRSAADAITRGVKRVHICGWRGSHTLSEELNSAKQQGTCILR